MELLLGVLEWGWFKSIKIMIFICEIGMISWQIDQMCVLYLFIYANVKGTFVGSSKSYSKSIEIK